MSDTGNLEGGSAEVDRGSDINNGREKRPFVMTPEKWEELHRPVMTPEMMESFNRYWFNKGKEGGSPPTPATFQQTGFDFDGGMLSKALDSFNRGSASAREQIITNVIVQNAPALAQLIIAASNSASAHEQIIVNVIVQNAPALAQSILAASAPNFSASYSASTLEQIILNVIVENASALVQRILGALPGANGGIQQPNGGN